MLEETILGTAVGMLILLFFFTNYRFSTKGHDMERTAQFQKPSIPCPYCGTVLGSSDWLCPNCYVPREKLL